MEEKKRAKVRGVGGGVKREVFCKKARSQASAGYFSDRFFEWPTRMGPAVPDVNVFLMALAHLLIRPGGETGVSCGYEIACFASRHIRAFEPGGPPVSDVIFTVLSVAFFVLCVAYTGFCEKVR